MKKRRSTVLVTPGKDVTLYIPSDTPPEVIRYLNRLKAEGIFSQGIMDILTRHILQDQPTRGTEESRSAISYNFENDVPELLADPLQDEVLEQYETVQQSQTSFNLEQIFQQASRNAGKLHR